MRTTTTAQNEVLTRGKFKVALKVEIEDSTATLVDVSNFEGRNWIRSVTINENVDEPVTSPRIQLFARRYDLSMHPLDKKSKINLPGGVYAPFLDIKRQIRVLTATVPQDYTPVAGDFELVFDGFIDKIPEPGKRGNEIVLECRGKGGVLQDTWIEDLERYGDGSVDDTDHVFADLEDILQEILDNWASGTTLFSENGTGGTPFLPGDTPGFNVEAWDVDIQSVMDALRIGANSIGWECRYRFQDNVGEYELQLYEPPRGSAVVDRTFGPGDYIDIRSLTIDVSTVRNVVEVTYFTDPEDDQSRATIEVSDAASITRYGRRWMGIVEAQSSAINTAVEANKMANAILGDLREPDRDQEIEMHYFWAVQLGDRYTFQANDVNYTINQTWAVVGIRHFLTPTKTRTIITTRRAPSGGIRHWWDRGQFAGVGDILKDKNPAPPTVTANTLDHGVLIEWTNPQIRSGRVSYYEVHLSLSASFTPGPSTLLARTRGTRHRAMGLDQETPYFFKILAIDREGNISSNSNEVTSVPGFLRGYPGQLVTSLPAASSLQPAQMFLFEDKMYRRWKKTYDELVLDIDNGDEALWYLKQDETSGGTAADASSNGNDFTYDNTPNLAQTALFNDGGNSVEYRATNERASLLNQNVGGVTQFSFDTWMDVVASTAIQTVLHARATLGGAMTVLIQFASGLNGALVLNIGPTVQTSTKTFKEDFFDAGPIHLAITWDGPSGVLNVYKNGTLIETFAGIETGNSFNFDDWYLGNDSSATIALGGKLDSSAAWLGRTITVNEIRERVIRGIQENVNFEILSAALGTEMRLALDVYLSGPQSIAAAATTTAQFNRVVFNQGMLIDPGGVVTFLDPGKYLIVGYAYWSTIGTGKISAAHIFKNGSRIRCGQQGPGVGGGNDICNIVIEVIDVVADDTMTLRANNGDVLARNLIAGTAFTAMKVFKIGA